MACRHGHHDHVAATGAQTVHANLTVTKVPFADGEIHAHLRDTSPAPTSRSL